MGYIFYLISILILLYLWHAYHDFLHPAFITQSIWFFIIVIYNCYISLSEIWIGLSEKFYLLLIIYSVVFFTASCLFSRVNVCTIDSVKEIPFSLKHTTLLNISILFLTILDFYYIFLILRVGFGSVREETLFGATLPVYIKVVSYSLPLGISLFFLGIRDSNFRKQNGIKLFILFVLIVVASFTSTNKGGLIQLAISSLFFLKVEGRLSIKNLFILIVFFITTVFILQILRGGMGANRQGVLERIQTFLYIYLLSPLPAFDAVITGKKILDTGFWGGLSLSFAYRVFYKLGLIEVIPSTLIDEQKWIGVPYATNVYTLLGDYYIDFGVMGVIFCAFLYGVIFGKLYFNIRLINNTSSKLFYGIFIYVLIFQFFGDWFFGFFSVTVQYAFWIFILVHTFKFE